VLAAAATLPLILGVLNAYYAGAAKLGAALARDGAFPSWLARGSHAGEVPRRSLGVLSVLTLAVMLVVAAFGVGATPLVFLTTGLFVAVYAVGVAAAVRLLPRRSKARAAAMVSLAVVGVLLVLYGPYLAWPLVVSGAALLYLRINQRRLRINQRHPRINWRRTSRQARDPPPATVYQRQRLPPSP
jgi:amino acid efflux transporter